MAEEKQDNILEEENAKDEEKQTPKGLSTSLLIKVAIGLAVLLIALIAAFFLLSSSPETDTATAEETELNESVAVEDPADNLEEPAVVTPESGTIELPALTETTSSSAPAPVAAAESSVNQTTPGTPAQQPASASPNKVLSEMVALQKQLNTMRQENQMLIKRVEQLVKENQTLKSGTPLADSASASTSSLLNDDQLVNNDDVPLYYRQNRYANTPQPELKPQWGEFQQPGTQQR